MPGHGRPDFSRFYKISGLGLPDALHVRLAPSNAWKEFLGNPKRLSLLTKGISAPTNALEFFRQDGNVPYDYISTSLVNVHLFSDRVFGCFRQHGFEGWKTFPAIVRGGDGFIMPAYQGLAVTGRCGPIDSSMSHQLPPQDVESADADASPVLIGLYFQLETWDGSHIFSPDGASHVFVVEEVKAALERIGATNFRFRSLNELENRRASLRRWNESRVKKSGDAGYQ